MSALLAHEESGAGRPLVFLHGITADRSHWRPVAERLRGRYRCINVDLLSHGESPEAPSADLFSQLEAVTLLLDHLSLDAPVLVGHSFGAFVATFTATARPLAGVVNVDQTFDTVAFRRQIEPLAPRLRGDDFAAAFDDFVTTQRPDLVPADHQDMIRSHIRPRQDVVLSVWGAVLDTPPSELLAQVEAALPAVSAPYLGIFGSALSAEEQRLQALVPRSQVEVWDGLGHFVVLVDPDRTAERIAQHVESLPR